MKLDKIRSKDNTSKTMSMSVECPGHTKHLQRKPAPYRNRRKPIGLVCGNHEFEREECQERACQWDERGDTRLQSKHRSESWNCRAAQYGDAILAPKRRPKEQTRCLYKIY
jgi:hypothetical protein